MDKLRLTVHIQSEILDVKESIWSDGGTFKYWKKLTRAYPIYLPNVIFYIKRLAKHRRELRHLNRELKQISYAQPNSNKIPDREA